MARRRTTIRLPATESLAVSIIWSAIEARFRSHRALGRLPVSHPVFRIHPAINFARVGNSPEYYLAPETIAGMKLPPHNPDAGTALTGGLPVRAGTEQQSIRSSDLRDAHGRLKRQAARFRVFAYDEKHAWPHGGGEEVTIGSDIGGRRVRSITWSVHLANKKSNCYVLEATEEQTAYLAGANPEVTISPSGVTTSTTTAAQEISYSQSYTGPVIDMYAGGATPPLRNPQEGRDPNAPERVRRLTIDPGPRTVAGAAHAPVAFDQPTVASWCGPNGHVEKLQGYPKSFPGDTLHFAPGVTPIETLGEIATDAEGRLIVLPGYGRAVPWLNPRTKASFPLPNAVDNDGWFDDTSDGPVLATIAFEDGTTVEAVHGWVNCTDPGYAPQVLNVLSLWDDIYDTFVRKLELRPDLFNGTHYVHGYKPGFDDDLKPIFRAAALIKWSTNLPDIAQRGHDAVDAITAADDPARTVLAGLRLIRNPNNPGEADVGAPLMPLALGDSGDPFLSVTKTQYFYLSQWNDGHFQPGPATKLGPGEYLDQAALANCLGGRFSPGIDMTFITRQTDLYIEDWKKSGVGPFRIARKPLDYLGAKADKPLLGEGYVPLHSGANSIEPGDCSKFMALPWHTDYNSCATHPTSPNIPVSTTLYWSWPAQRPVAVYVASEVKQPGGKPEIYRYSLRGPGTESTDFADQGRYQDNLDIIANWWKIGFVIQAPAIDDGRKYRPDQYLEVQSLLDDTGVPPWPINASDLADAG
jgi:hypothetical protein